MRSEVTQKCSNLWVLTCVPGSTTFQSQLHPWCISQMCIPTVHLRYASLLCIQNVRHCFSSMLHILDVHIPAVFQMCTTQLCTFQLCSRCTHSSCVPDVLQMCLWWIWLQVSGSSAMNNGIGAVKETVVRVCLNKCKRTVSRNQKKLYAHMCIHRDRWDKTMTK